MKTLLKFVFALGAFACTLAAATPTLEEWKTKALAGDTTAQVAVGMFYDRGDGVKQNYKEAAKWYEMAAKAGDAHGQNNLGSLYLEGAGVKKDYAKALELFRKAAAQGNANAQCSLGLMIEEGWGTAKNLPTAFDWYRKAAELGSPQAMQNLALGYINGTGVEKNDTEAVRWLTKSAEAGLGSAQQRLAVAFDRGLFGLTEDPKQALPWFRKAAEQESIEAAAAIGSYYAKGRGVQTDLIEAYGWLEICRTATLSLLKLSPNLKLKYDVRHELGQVMKQLSDDQIKQGNRRATEIWVELYKARYHSDPDPKRIPTFYGMPRAFAQ